MLHYDYEPFTPYNILQHNCIHRERRETPLNTTHIRTALRAQITSSGRLFGVGANDYGQLGSAPPLSEDEWGLPLPKEEDRNWSEAVRRHWRGRTRGHGRPQNGYLFNVSAVLMSVCVSHLQALRWLGAALDSRRLRCTVDPGLLF